MEPNGGVANRDFSSLTALEKKEIAQADANGFVFGYGVGGLMWARIVSAYVSGVTTSDILGGTWGK